VSSSNVIEAADAAEAEELAIARWRGRPARLHVQAAAHRAWA
jgi:hypothetical protein